MKNISILYNTNFYQYVPMFWVFYHSIYAQVPNKIECGYYSSLDKHGFTIKMLTTGPSSFSLHDIGSVVLPLNWYKPVGFSVGTKVYVSNTFYI